VSHRKSFTLIELLIAVSIFSVVAVSVYSAFNTGVFTWRRINVEAESYQGAAVALELMANEIANHIPSEVVVISGEKDNISFLSNVNKAGKNNLYKTVFFFDSSKNAIIYGYKDLRVFLNEANTEGASVSTYETDANILKEEFLPDVKSLEFKYFCKKSDSANNDEYEWVDLLSPDKKAACRAVSITIALSPKQDNRFQAKGNDIKFTKIVPIYTENNNNAQKSS